MRTVFYSAVIVLLIGLSFLASKSLVKVERLEREAQKAEDLSFSIQSELAMRTEIVEFRARALESENDALRAKVDSLVENCRKPKKSAKRITHSSETNTWHYPKYSGNFRMCNPPKVKVFIQERHPLLKPNRNLLKWNRWYSTPLPPSIRPEFREREEAFQKGKVCKKLCVGTQCMEGCTPKLSCSLKTDASSRETGTEGSCRGW